MKFILAACAFVAALVNPVETTYVPHVDQFCAEVKDGSQFVSDLENAASYFMRGSVGYAENIERIIQCVRHVILEQRELFSEEELESIKTNREVLRVIRSILYVIQNGQYNDHYSFLQDYCIDEMEETCRQIEANIKQEIERKAEENKAKAEKAEQPVRKSSRERHRDNVRERVNQHKSRPK